MRVLGRVRISRVSEESTSVERQREIIEGWARQNDHEIIGWAEDLDVSGSVDPFKAPALGPWFRDEKPYEWDILCCWKLDRLTRSAIRLNDVIKWCLENDKTIMSCEESIDISTPVGRLIAGVIGFLAEGEREAISERTRSSQKKLRELGRWGGGKPVYGYKAVERDDAAGWELVPDEHTSVVLLSVIDRVLDGQSTESVATWLNEQGELTPADYIRQRSGKPTKGARWSNATLRQLLKSKSLLGHSTHKGATVRDADGLPVQKGAPLISQDVYDRLQAALDSRSFKVTNRSAKASPLLGVLACGAVPHGPDCKRDSSCGCPPCGRLMHLRQNHSKARGKTYRYYQCLGGGSSGGGGATPEHEANIVKADLAEELAEQTFLDAYGDEHVKERKFIPAENHQNELDEAVRAAEEITAALGTATSKTLRKFYQGQLGALDSRIGQLEKLPTSEARWEWSELPQTYADAWEEADTEARRQLLLKRLVSLRVYVPKGTNALEAHLYAMDLPPKLFERQTLP